MKAGRRRGSWIFGSAGCSVVAFVGWSGVLGIAVEAGVVGMFRSSVARVLTSGDDAALMSISRL